MFAPCCWCRLIGQAWLSSWVWTVLRRRRSGQLFDHLVAGVDVPAALLLTEGAVRVVVGGRGADNVETLGGGGVEVEVRTGQVVFELLQGLRPDDGRDHAG